LPSGGVEVFSGGPLKRDMVGGFGSSRTVDPTPDRRARHGGELRSDAVSQGGSWTAQALGDGTRDGWARRDDVEVRRQQAQVNGGATVEQLALSSWLPTTTAHGAIGGLIRQATSSTAREVRSA
jgi:hypothetical protein